jgi:glycosyltransferase involved in cell wall biosynthesis
MTPSLSICIVVRNGAADLPRTLASLDRQLAWLSRLPTEVVVVDGESTDASANLARAWASRCKLPVHLLSQPPRGIYAAMNEAWLQARGEWLLFINAGDLLLDAAPLAAAQATANAGHQDSIQFGAAVFIPGASRGLWIPGRHPACHQSLVYRRNLHHLYGPYDDRLGICADRLFIQRIPAHGRLLRPELLAATQVSPANASRDPDRLRRDLGTIRALGLAFRPVSRPWLSLPVLRLERLLGISLSVWLRLGVHQLLGSVRTVDLD